VEAEVKRQKYRLAKKKCHGKKGILKLFLD
jgi:hypothetical protein